MTLDRRINAPQTATGRRLRRKYKSKNLLIPAIIGKGDTTNPLTADGQIWVRRTASKNNNDNMEYGPPELVSVGVADYWTDNGTKVFIQKDPSYGEWEVARADLRDAKEKGRNAAQLNTGVPQNKYLRLKNAVRLICRPVGGNPSDSTLVGVRGTVYEDNYFDLTRFKATGLVTDMLDLSSYIPSAGNHAVVVVHLDTYNNTLAVTSSTAQSIGTDLDMTDYQEAIGADIWNDYIPIQAFHLGNGQSSIDNRHLGEDLRQFVNMPQALGNEMTLTLNTRVRPNRQLFMAGSLTLTPGITLQIEPGGQVVVMPLA